MALLLALSASPEELEVAMISVTYGNVPLQRYDRHRVTNTRPVNVVSQGCCRCLRNVVALFHVLEKEMAWRKATGKPTYSSLGAYKPIVAVGAQHALEDEELVADNFRKHEPINDPGGV